jgi:hypothetical protein
VKTVIQKRSAAWTFKATRLEHGSRDLPGGGTSKWSTRVPDGLVIVRFSIEVDREALGRLSVRAAENKDGVCRLQGGAVEVDRKGGVLVFEDRLIRAIGSRAAFSPRGVTKLQGGALVVKVVEKRRLDIQGNEVRA